MNILAYRWFSGRYTVGAVLAKTHAGYKAYLGPAMDITEIKDAEFIAKWGAKLEVEVARSIFPQFIVEGKQYDGKIVRSQAQSVPNIVG